LFTKRLWTPLLRAKLSVSVGKHGSWGDIERDEMGVRLIRLVMAAFHHRAKSQSGNCGAVDFNRAKYNIPIPLWGSRHGGAKQGD
jgi:hypothetical protein